MKDARFEELLTAATTPDIAPRLVNGEPVCSGTKCRRHPSNQEDGPECQQGLTGDVGDPCILGLRRQRDALQSERDAANDAYYMECRLRESTTAERDAARRELCEKSAENKRRMAGVIAWRGRDEADVRGWSELYEKEKP